MERLRMVGEGLGFAGVLMVLLVWGEVAQAVIG